MKGKFISYFFSMKNFKKYTIMLMIVLTIFASAFSVTTYGFGAGDGDGAGGVGGEGSDGVGDGGNDGGGYGGDGDTSGGEFGGLGPNGEGDGGNDGGGYGGDGDTSGGEFGGLGPNGEGDGLPDIDQGYSGGFGYSHDVGSDGHQSDDTGPYPGGYYSGDGNDEGGDYWSPETRGGLGGELPGNRGDGTRGNPVGEIIGDGEQTTGGVGNSNDNPDDPPGPPPVGPDTPSPLQLGADISIQKYSGNPNDTDGVLYDDTQTIYNGDKSVFRVIVTNNGGQHLKSIVIEDSSSPDCSGSVDLVGRRIGGNNIILVGGRGDHDDDILRMGEAFTYECELENTRSNFSPQIKVNGVSNQDNTNVSSTDNTQVVVLIPSIDIVQYSSNLIDTDGMIEHNPDDDSQTIYYSSNSVFQVKVTNDGEEDLSDITLIDELAPNCAGVLVGGRVGNNLVNFSGDGNHSDDILQVNEVMTYGCDRGNVVSSYINNIRVDALGTGVRGIGEGSRENVNDSDDSEVIVLTPSVEIIMYSSNINDLDGITENSTINDGSDGFGYDYDNQFIIGSGDLGYNNNPPDDLSYDIFNDSQTIYYSDSSVFQVKVRNNGEEDLDTITFTDELAPNCAGVLNGGRVGNNLVSFSGDGNHSDDILQVNEIMTYDCNRGNVVSSYINNIRVDALGTGVRGIGEGSRENVNASDDAEVIVLIPSVEISIYSSNINDLDGINGIIRNNRVINRFTPMLIDIPGSSYSENENDPSNDSQTIYYSDSSVFQVKITNNGDEDLDNIEITNELTPDCAGVLSGREVGDNPVEFFGFGNHNDNVLQVNESMIYNCDRGDVISNYNSNIRVDGVGVGVRGIGEGSRENVNASDDSEVIVLIPSVEISIYSSNINDLDGITENTTLNNDSDGFGYNNNPPDDLPYDIFNNSQTIYYSGSSVFQVQVINNGEEDLSDITLIDELTPNCTGVLRGGRVGNNSVSFSGDGDHSDDILQVNEVMIYDCNRGNIVSSYVNNIRVDALGAGVRGIGEGSRENVNDSDNSEVIVLIPSIKIEKYAGDSLDLDGTNEVIPSNDSQTINFGQRSVFQIRVTNNGDEDLGNIVLSDEMSPNCSGTLSGERIGNNSVIFSGSGNHSDDILQVNEVVTYNCDKSDIRSNYTNMAIVEGLGVGIRGIGEGSRKDVTNRDVSEVIVRFVSSISIEKYSGNPSDLDQIVDVSASNDSQTIFSGSSSIFQIKITNDGQENLNNLRVDDKLAPDCSGRIDFATNKIGDNSISFTGDGNHDDSILQIGESIIYECELENTNSNYKNFATVTGIGIITERAFNDIDSSEVVVLDPSIKIEMFSGNPDDLDGIISHTPSDDSQTIISGSNAIFMIRVTNNGNENLNNITLTDDPSTLPFSRLDCVGVLDGGRIGLNSVIFSGSGNHDNNILEAGEIFTYSCGRFNINESYSDKINVNGVVIEEQINVNNSDTTEVIVPFEDIASIDLKLYSGNPNDLDGITTDSPILNDSQTILSGNKSIFRVRVTNNGEKSLSNIVLTSLNSPNCSGILDFETDKIGNNSVLFTGSGDYENNILEVGEVFIYNCERENIVSDYTNAIFVDGISIDGQTSVNDNDTTEVVVSFGKKSSIDLDGISIDSPILNDSQTIVYLDNAIFQVKVTNNGVENLRNITITDDFSNLGVSSCNGNLNFETARIGSNPVTFSGTGNHSDDILQIGESFVYNCENQNVESSRSTNMEVNGFGEISGVNVRDTDSSDILILRPNISIEKYSGNPNDLDGETNHNPSNDSQIITGRGSSIFEIRITNNGTEDLKDIVVEDILTPSCSGVVNFTENKLGINDIVFSGIGNHDDNILQVGEIFTYNCEKTNTTLSYINTALVKGEGVITGVEINASDRSDVIVIPSINILIYSGNPYDLDGVTVDSPTLNDSQIISFRDNGVFKIRVSNDGTEDLTDISTFLLNSDCSGDLNFNTHMIGGHEVVFSGDGNHNDNVLQTGEVFTYTCSSQNIDTTSFITAVANGVGATSGIGISDADSSSVIVLPPKYALLTIYPNILEVGIDDLNKNLLLNSKSELLVSDSQDIGGSIDIKYLDLNGIQISFTNNTGEDLMDINVHTMFSSTCSGDLNFSKNSLLGNEVSFSGKGNHRDNVLQVGETFTYECSKSIGVDRYREVFLVNSLGKTSKTSLSSSFVSDLH